MVGWITKKYPEVVKKIDKLGFEIGSHTYMHQLMYEQSPREVEEDLKQSIYVLEDLTGKKGDLFVHRDFQSPKKTNGLLRFWPIKVLHMIAQYSQQAERMAAFQAIKKQFRQDSSVMELN